MKSGEINSLFKNLSKAIKNPKSDLKYKSKFTLLVSVVLSAQCTDVNVNNVTKNIYPKYNKPEHFVKLGQKKIEKLIKSIGLFRNKAKSVYLLSKLLIEKHNGKVPNNFEDLYDLPGVGRKTANCVLVYAYEKPAIPVDIHVHRISNRLGLVKTKNPEETEFELMKITPKRLWLDINETFVKYGQNICKPISPMCNVCKITNSCKYYKTKKNAS